MFVDFWSEDDAVSDLDGYEILDLLREQFTDTSGYIVSVEAEEGGPPIGKPLQLSVSGDNEIAHIDLIMGPRGSAVEVLLT